jgi:hypothetical protein
MAHFLCGERRVLRRPNARNMGGRRPNAKTAQDEISVMLKNAAPRDRDSRKKATQRRNSRAVAQKPWQAAAHGSYSVAQGRWRPSGNFQS